VDPKTKEFLKPAEMTMAYFIGLTALAFLALLINLGLCDPISCQYTSIFAFYPYLLSFILCIPLMLIFLLPNVASLIILIPLELLYLYILALILSKMMKTKQVLVIIGIFLIIGFCIWETEKPQGGKYGIVAAGWAKLQPLSASITYKSSKYSEEINQNAGVYYRPNHNFEVTFQNAVGTSIRLTCIVMSEALVPTPNNCNLTNVSGTAWVEGNSEQKVMAGEGFKVVAICPAKSEGDPFDVQINMSYTSVMGGISTNHSESGHIRGHVEA
jgi:hypothetical protein